MLLGVAALMARPVLAAELIRSGPSKVSLLEVYSSEGCSSCPPADQWLASLVQNDRLWKEFVPVVFHVDYWDYLGWRDGFADQSFSQRQYDYASLWGGTSRVYTPGFVLDGKEWRGRWSSSDIPSPPKKEAGLLTVEDFGDGRFYVSFTKKNSYLPSYKVHAVLMGFEVKSYVRNGENVGKHLRHNFIVLDKALYPLKKSGVETYTGIVRLSSAHETKRRAIAVWVEERDDPTPLQAAGQFLS